MSKRKILSLKEKISILEDVDNGLKKKDIALKFGIPPNSLSTLLKNREKIEQNYIVSLNSNSSVKRIKTCTYEDVDQAILKWVQTIRDKKVPVSGPLIMEKALEFAKTLGHEDFRASTGWLEKFKRRHGILAKVLSGESADVNEEICGNWIKETLSKILKEYKPKDIFNADETGLFFQCLPQKTLTFKNDKCFGTKQSKIRVTVMLGANMTGDQKLKPLVIGRSKNPRCFKGAKTLEVDYDFNKKAWMTSEICEKWAKKLDKRMIDQGRKIILIFDNCPAHPADLNKKLKNITVVYLPPNTTSKLQPMDQGVIKTFKMHYRKRILSKVITSIENNNPIFAIKLRDSIADISKVWNHDVTESTIRNSFAKAGFVTSNDINLNPDNNEENLSMAELQKMWLQLKECGEISDIIQVSDFLSIDEDVETSGTLTDMDILESVKNHNNDVSDDDDESNDLNEEQLARPSNEEMTKAFELIRRGLQCEENTPEDVFRALQRCETYYERKNLSRAKIQTQLTDFFTK